MRRCAFASLLAALGCGASPQVTPPDFVDCQPRRDSVAFFSRPAFDVGPRMEPAGVPLDVAVAFVEPCQAEQLATLRPAGSATGPDNVTHPLEVRVSRETADDGRPMLVATVSPTPDVPGWWLVELSLDPGWARHQTLVYVIENHADAPRHFESVGQAVSSCVYLQRVAGGTFVCGDTQSRQGVPQGSLGGYPVVTGDTAWVADGARVVRFEDSATGLRTTGTRVGDLRPLQAEPGRVLAAEFDSGGLRGYRVLGWDGGAELVDEAWAGPSSPVVLRRGELVPLCPGPACEAQVLGLAGDQVYFVRAFSETLERLPADGGVAERIDLGPAGVRALGPGLVDGRPLGVATSGGPVALLHDLAGTPRVVWLGDEVVGFGDGVALVRGRSDSEVAVVPLDF